MIEGVQYFWYIIKSLEHCEPMRCIGFEIWTNQSNGAVRPLHLAAWLSTQYSVYLGSFDIPVINAVITNVNPTTAKFHKISNVI